ncbi:MAG: hypothetical protein AB7O43_15170 [Hyphomicrobiaceae bacterium]
MSSLPVAFRSNRGPFNFLGTTSLVNCYAVQLGNDAKATYAAISCPGTAVFSAGPDTPIRGAIFMEDLDALYTVHSSSVWKRASDGTKTRIGTIPGIDRVQIVRNQKTTPQIVIRCDRGLYLIENDTLTGLSDPDIPTDCVAIAEVSSRIVYGSANGRWYISAINDANDVDPLDFATAEQAADRLVTLGALGGELFVFGTETIEPWINTGNASFPFELRSQASVIKKGCLAQFSVVVADNTFFWVGNDRKYYRLNGYSVLKVSSEEVDRLILNDPNQSAISATSYSYAGHDFVAVTGTDWTAEYDIATGLWHTRTSYQASRWRHDVAMAAWGKVLVGSRENGTIYYLDADTHTEAGLTFIREVTMPPLHGFPNGGIIDALHFDVATGQGVTSPLALGYEPQIMVLISRDGGNSFNLERRLKTGRSGQYRRVTSRRWGRFAEKGAVIRIRQSDPVGFALALVDHSTRPLRA